MNKWLTRYQKRAAVWNRMVGYQRRWGKNPICPICNRVELSKSDFHEIIGRGRLGSARMLDLLPVPLHAIICRSCHEGQSIVPSNTLLNEKHPQTPEMITFLLQESIKLWGFDAVNTAIELIENEANHNLHIEEWENIKCLYH